MLLRESCLVGVGGGHCGEGKKEKTGGGWRASATCPGYQVGSKWMAFARTMLSCYLYCSLLSMYLVSIGPRRCVCGGKDGERKEWKLWKDGQHRDGVGKPVHVMSSSNLGMMKLTIISLFHREVVGRCIWIDVVGGVKDRSCEKRRKKGLEIEIQTLDVLGRFTTNQPFATFLIFSCFRSRLCPYSPALPIPRQLLILLMRLF